MSLKNLFENIKQSESEGKTSKEEIETVASMIVQAVEYSEFYSLSSNSIKEVLKLSKELEGPTAIKLLNELIKVHQQNAVEFFPFISISRGSMREEAIKLLNSLHIPIIDEAFSEVSDDIKSDKDEFVLLNKKIESLKREIKGLHEIISALVKICKTSEENLEDVVKKYNRVGGKEDRSSIKQDMESVKVYMKKGIKAESGSHIFKTLYKAADSGDLGAVKSLSKVCNLNNSEYLFNNVLLNKSIGSSEAICCAIESNDKVLLHNAVKNNRADIVRVLIACGSGENVVDCHLKTPLHYAVSSENAECVRLLTYEDMLLNKFDEEGETPLSIAIKVNNPLIFEILLNTQTNFNVLDAFWLHNANFAATMKDLIIFKMILRSILPNINQKLDGGKTILHYFAQLNADEACSVLLDMGANQFIRDDDHKMPIDLALEHLEDNFATISVLLGLKRSDAKIKELLRSGDTNAFFLSVLDNKCRSAFRVLLEAGFYDGMKSFDDGMTLLHYVAMMGTEEQVRRYSKTHSAEINTKDLHVRSPLTYSLLAGEGANARALMEAGAVPEKAPFNTGLLAAKCGDSEVFWEAVRRGADVNGAEQNAGPLFEAIAEGSKEGALLLIAANANPNVRNTATKESTPLLKAIERGMVEVVLALLKAGADPNAEDGNRRTPLLVGLYGGDDEGEGMRIERALLEAGADPNKECCFREKPLYYAIVECPLVFVKELIDHGADLEGDIFWGRNAMQVAKEAKRKDVIEYLIKIGVKR